MGTRPELHRNPQSVNRVRSGSSAPSFVLFLSAARPERPRLAAGASFPAPLAQSPPPISQKKDTSSPDFRVSGWLGLRTETGTPRAGEETVWDVSLLAARGSWSSSAAVLPFDVSLIQLLAERPSEAMSTMGHNEIWGCNLEGVQRTK